MSLFEAVALTVSVAQATYRALFFGSAGLCGNGAMLAVLWHGGHLLDSGLISVGILTLQPPMHAARIRFAAGDLTAFLLYTVYVGGSITGLASFQAELMKGLGASSRLWELLDSVPEPRPEHTLSR